MENKTGYVYVLTNPSFKEDWVKIGKSMKPPNMRSKELDNTAVPLPYEVYATLETAKYNEAECSIHELIEKIHPKLRIRKNREFFNIKPEDAVGILEKIARLLDDAKVKYYREERSTVSTGKRKNKKEQKRPAFSFYDKGLKNGDEIVFVKDCNITAIVSGEKNVEFENKSNWSVTGLTRELFRRMDPLTERQKYDGPAYFTFNGIKLKDLPNKEEI